MKILVPVKRVVDYNVRVRAKADGSGVALDNVKMSMNPFDEIAVEEAVRLREAGTAQEVLAVSIGGDKVAETLRAALAMGADKAIHITTNAIIQPLAAAKVMHAIVKTHAPDLVIMGKQAIDDDANQTGQMLAGLLNWPQGTFISELHIEDGAAHITREVDGGLMQLCLTLPAIVTTDLRLNEPRYASLPNIMKARSKPLEVVEIASLDVDITPRMHVQQVSEPAKRSAGVKLESVEALLGVLRSKGII